MEVEWNSSSEVVITCDDVEFSALCCILLKDVMACNSGEWPENPLLRTLYADLQKGMDGRNKVKQKERR